MKQVRKDGTTGMLPLLPYSSMAANGFIWIAYGALLSNPAIWLPNITSLVMGSYFVWQFHKYCPPGADWLPSTRSTHAAGVAAIVAGVAAVVGTLDAETAAKVVGYTGDAIVIAMFGGPLAAIKTVLKEKSTKSLPFAFTVATFINCSLWTVYGTMVLADPIIWFPNVLGLASACVQLSCFARFGFHKDGGGGGGGDGSTPEEGGDTGSRKV